MGKLDSTCAAPHRALELLPQVLEDEVVQRVPRRRYLVAAELLRGGLLFWFFGFLWMVGG